MSLPVTARRQNRDVTVIDLIGNTPLLRLKRFENGLHDVELYGKAEWFNPGGSVKDRPAANMVKEGVKSGALRAGQDAARRHVREHRHCLRHARRQHGVSRQAVRAVERHRGAQALAARLRRGNDLHRSHGRLRRRHPRGAEAGGGGSGGVFLSGSVQQSPRTGARTTHTTGPEILAQTEGRITHFVAGLGTSGTFMGTGRWLREANPAIKLMSFQPDSPLHGLEGLKHMETAIVPGIYDPSLADEDMRVSTEDAYTMVRRLAREEGLLVGISGGAALAAALKVARGVRNAVIVTIFPDSADKYMSERFWQLPV